MKICKPNEYNIEFCLNEQKTINDCLSLLKNITESMRDKECNFIAWAREEEQVEIDCIETMQDWLDTILHADIIH